MNKEEVAANNYLFQNSYLLDDTKEEKLTPAENTEYERYYAMITDDSDSNF